MKKMICLLVLLLLVSGCDEVNPGYLIGAGIDLFRTVTLDAGDVQQLSNRTADYMDEQNEIALNYSERLKRLTGDAPPGYNFKVYKSDEVNAFALGDGSIRIYSGLMELMSDDELRFVIGHEIGHVKNNHTLEKMRMAYGASAARKGLASLKNEVGALARSEIGDFSYHLLNAQFSQAEEREADDYGLRYLQERGYDEGAAVSALEKLSGGSYSFLSSHPAPKKRAERLREKIGD